MTVVNTDNREQTYEITVEVEEETEFDPANNILVTRDEPVLMRNTKKGKRDEELAETVGEIYTAKVFAVDEYSTDYVELTWAE